jgi:hypothetical protein
MGAVGPRGPAVNAVARADKIAAAEAAYWRRVREARDDFAVFVELVVRDQNGAAIQVAPIHRAWFQHVDYCWSRGLHAMIWAPFGSGKTSTLSVPMAAWLVGRNVQERLKVVCNGDQFASQRVAAAKEIIESPEYADVFPGVVKGRKWTDHEVYVRRAGASVDPSIHARGVLTKGVGGRADHILFDDVVDQDNAAEEGMRTKVKSRVDQTWMSRVDQQNGLALWIATPWHTDDASHAILGKKEWCTLVVSVREDRGGFDLHVLGAGADYDDLMAAALAPAQ